MELNNSSILIQTYFLVKPEDNKSFNKLSEDLLESTRGEMGCVLFGFSYSIDRICCIEAYQHAQALMSHLSNIEDTFLRLTQVATIVNRDIHGPKDQLILLKEFLVSDNANYYSIASYFHNY